MVVKQTRKSSREIKEKILTNLKEGALSTKQLSELLNSNWSTINNYLEELKTESLVREIYSRENLKVYVRSDYPVFYGLPLDKKKLNDSVFLLSEIIKKWQEKHKETISKTTMQKVAVEVILKNNLDIPIVKFHYGKVLTTFLNPEKYQETIKIYEIKKPTDSEAIIKAVKKEIDTEEHDNSAWKEKRRQYENHEDMKIYLASDNIYKNVLKKEINNKELLNNFSEVLLHMPISDDYSYLFDKYSDFLSGVYFIFNTKEFQENSKQKENLLKEILDTFNSFWDLLTIEFYFNEFKNICPEDFKEYLKNIKQDKINMSLFNLEDKLINLLDYKTSLSYLPKKLDNTEQEVLNILLEGADEE